MRQIRRDDQTVRGLDCDLGDARRAHCDCAPHATRPQPIADEWDYFTNSQSKSMKYKSYVTPTDGPPTWLIAEIVAQWRPQMNQFYYDPSKFK